MLTNGLEYDDRIRKEMLSMKEVLGDVEFKIFGFHGDNRTESGMLSYGVPYELVSLKSRGGSKGLISMLRKEYDFYKQIVPKIKDYDLLWVCDHQPFFFPLLSPKTIIWDLHEIPATIIGSRIKNILFHRMERRCKWLIHANHERIEYLSNRGVLCKPCKNLVLRNYPDQKWLSEGASTPQSYTKFKEWLGNEEYVYLQGINSESRYPLQTLFAILEIKKIKAVVIGNISEEVKRQVNEKYPDADKYIYYTGQVVQSETAPFMAHCKFSIVFYTMKTANNRYCEPNRMFQCLGLGKPVIVGCNEPMKNAVVQYGNGIAIESDGSIIEENVEAIKNMMNYYEKYLSNAVKSKKEFSWEAQNDVIKNLFL